ncbi:predicted protein [Histoplasma capsulatum var. duboisii H88]|uniref:Predicted protein n=1 Tax=Ajellomyces capsulatus (strain H88) TaxID=544711 RepID=F0UEP2_AJEC8|nr:predicted protein [Histoplasma capsulatum var. duboisii H88]
MSTALFVGRSFKTFSKISANNPSATHTINVSSPSPQANERNTMLLWSWHLGTVKCVPRPAFLLISHFSIYRYGLLTSERQSWLISHTRARSSSLLRTELTHQEKVFIRRSVLHEHISRGPKGVWKKSPTAVDGATLEGYDGMVPHTDGDGCHCSNPEMKDGRRSSK